MLLSFTKSSDCVFLSGLVDLEIENRNEKDEKPVRQIDEDSSRTPDRAGKLDAPWSWWRPKVAQVVPELQLRMRKVDHYFPFVLNISDPTFAQSHWSQQNRHEIVNAESLTDKIDKEDIKAAT